MSNGWRTRWSARISRRNIFVHRTASKFPAIWWAKAARCSPWGTWTRTTTGAVTARHPMIPAAVAPSGPFLPNLGPRFVVIFSTDNWFIHRACQILFISSFVVNRNEMGKRHQPGRERRSHRWWTFDSVPPSPMRWRRFSAVAPMNRWRNCRIPWPISRTKASRISRKQLPYSRCDKRHSLQYSFQLNGSVPDWGLNDTNRRSVDWLIEWHCIGRWFRSIK